MQHAVPTKTINRKSYSEDYLGYTSTPSVRGRYKKLSVVKARSRGMRRFQYTILVLFFAMLLMALLYSNAQLTEQVGEIEKLDAQLVLLESEYAYQSFDLERRTSLNEVEEYAIRELGLIKNDGSKIEYVHLNSENELLVNEESLVGWQDTLSQNFMSILEYLKP